jgi:ribosomal protein S14
MAASKKGKSADPKVSRAADPSKPTGNAKKTCKQTGAVGDFLRSLNLSPACVS